MRKPPESVEMNCPLATVSTSSEAHQQVQKQFRTPTCDGFHCTAEDLAASPDEIEHRPMFYEGVFDAEGTIDINLVTWHELALGSVVVRGQAPRVYTNLPELLDFTSTNLDTYWRGAIGQIEDEGIEGLGEHDEAVAWIALGAACLHHLLSEHKLTSKSGAGRYIVAGLDDRWTKIGYEALRIREHPHNPSLYADLGQRGRDAYDLLAWLVEDGVKLPT